MKREVRVRLAVVGVIALFIALPFAFFVVGNWAGKKTSVAKSEAFCESVPIGANIATAQALAKAQRTPFWHKPDSLAYHFRFSAPGKNEAICEVGVDANGAIVSRRTRPIGLTPNVAD